MSGNPVKSFGSLDDWSGTLPADAVFPFSQKPTAAYDGSRAFGSHRTNSKTGGLRLHAGLDNYQALYTPVHAISAGTVIAVDRDFVRKGKLYAASGAVVAVRHPSLGVVVRYGEVVQTPKSQYDVKVRVGQEVKAGDLLAFLEDVYRPAGAMLHAEVYSASLFSDGDTFNGGNIYARCSALMKPTELFKALLAAGNFAPAT